MIHRVMAVCAVSLLLLPLVGCGSKDTEEAEKPAGTTAPINNNAPEAKNATGAAAPDSGLPPPGKPGMIRK